MLESQGLAPTPDLTLREPRKGYFHQYLQPLRENGLRDWIANYLHKPLRPRLVVDGLSISENDQKQQAEKMGGVMWDYARATIDALDEAAPRSIRVSPDATSPLENLVNDARSARQGEMDLLHTRPVKSWFGAEERKNRDRQINDILQAQGLTADQKSEKLILLGAQAAYALKALDIQLLPQVQMDEEEYQGKLQRVIEALQKKGRSETPEEINVTLRTEILERTRKYHEFLSAFALETLRECMKQAQRQYTPMPTYDAARVLELADIVGNPTSLQDMAEALRQFVKNPFLPDSPSGTGPLRAA